MATSFANVVVAISDWLWGPPILIILSAMAIYMSFKVGFIQFRHFGYIIGSTLGSAFRRDKERLNDGEGTLSSFQALTSAVACTVGAGNIAGVAFAIISGGPGAVFWMWLVALLAMALKYSEIALAVKYRDKNESGEWEGGPAKYMLKGIGGGLGKFLACFFAIFLMIEVAISSMTQSNQLAAVASVSWGLNPLILGIIAMILTGIVLLGGVKSLGKFTEKMVPVMAIIYIVGGLVIVFVNVGQIPAMLGMIFKDAFTGHAAAGGFAGSTFALAVRFGLARGVYSNEAGLGTAPIAHASATTDHPARQGLWGITEIFLDTIVICTMTAFVILSSGVWMNEGVTNLAGADVTALAFAEVFGKAGSSIVTLCMIMFVFSTLIVLIWYGEKQAEFLFKSQKVAVVYRILVILLIPVGAIGYGTYLWKFLDMALAMILFPNLIALLCLRKEIVDLTKEFFGTKGRYYLADKAEKEARKQAKRG